MGEERRENLVEQDLRNTERYGDINRPELYEEGSNFEEETSAELATPLSENRETKIDEGNGGRGWGYTSLVLSILSLFVLPVLLGAAGVILGFVARRRGAEVLGAWGIGIGAVSIIIGLFVLPFF
ncbi:hypothetical protein [Aeribacillus pallidus]|uniref:hypothetical protein n=1 Tax=Aeribacillus pallidus TaxID=33936 RepID=UPI001E129B52|nr:DUF4190 domain-containing protein [Bacillus sp. (in: firmicutes)]